MSTSHEVLEEFFECLRHLDSSIDRCVDLFADDGVFEFPYTPTLGIPSRFEGKEGVRGVVKLIASHFPAFTVSNVTIHEVTDGSLVVEYHAEAPLGDTGKVYAQDYISRLVAENGRIKLLREYLNTVSMARALLPNGLADVPGGAKT